MTASTAKFAIGIDLGTTTTAVGFVALDDDDAAFFGTVHGGEDEPGVEDLLAALVHEAGGGADVAVGEAGDVFLQDRKRDQPVSAFVPAV